MAELKKAKTAAGKTHRADGGDLPAVFGMVFLSGFAGLVYEVLWMRQSGLLFGSTAQAAATTLTAFFIGLAAGNGFWGRRSGTAAKPLRTYALLEAGIALTALTYFAILALFDALYPSLCRTFPGGPPLLLVKVTLALLLIFPPAFFMGGTLPMLGQHVIRNPSRFGRMAALLYGVNTLGAAVGAFCAAFFLVGRIGFRRTYVLAVLLSIGISSAAWRLSRGTRLPARAPAGDDARGRKAKRGTPRNAPAAAPTPRAFERATVRALCFLSGFGLLALEVLWTRLCAQVHTNSVYAFAAILTVVLTCLGLGAWISARLARLNAPPLATLGMLTTLGGIAIALSPAVFIRVTGGLRSLSSMAPWALYVPQIFFTGFAGIGIVVLVLGTIFPFLMKAEERAAAAGPGRALGGLLALNTVGAILGSLLCGFALLPVFRMWRTMRYLAAGYLAAGLLAPGGRGRALLARRIAAAVALALLFTLMDPARLPTTGVDPARPPETVLETWEGADCTVTAVENASGSRALRINSAYVLGSTGAYAEQAKQAVVPLTIYPATKSIFFLGLGTGITAGAALDPYFKQVKRVVSCELVPEVVEAARKYMPPALNGAVFDDPRSTVLVQDGRQVLRLTDKRFDLIDADLFLPYRQGAGSLYSIEHYRQARARLTPRGVFVQWLPLYQLTGREFGIIARTMLEAFGQVTMWRNNFEPGHEIVALLGQPSPGPIPPAPLEHRQEMLAAVRGLDWGDVPPGFAIPFDRYTIPFLYGGNLTAAKDLFEGYPVNTDDRPLVEYLAPRTFRKFTGDPIIWFVGPKIADLTDRLFARCPPEVDPVLRERPAADRRLALAGAAFHRARIYEVLGDDAAGARAWNTFVREWTHAAE